MSKHVALTDCPLRVVVDAPQSKIGYTYPRIFVEISLNENYVHFDLTLGAAFKMEAKDFTDWWEDAQPATTKEACEMIGVNEEAFRDLIRECIDKSKCAPEALNY